MGAAYAGGTGIGQLMEDLGAALADGSDMRMLGGGNPAHISEVQERFRDALRAALETERGFERLVGDYDGPRGNRPFIEAIANLLRAEYGWDIGPEHMALTNGSQSAFFMLFHLLAGEYADGSRRKILLPLTPEYIGYTDIGLGGPEGLFVSQRPRITIDDDDARLFKYHIDFDGLERFDNVGAVCVSRPTNPTGNVISDASVQRLAEFARRRGVPLILDNAYGAPFPNILFTDARPIWADNIVYCLSLSKFGLPAARTGIVVAPPEIASAIASLSAVTCLAPGKIGPALAEPLVRSGEILRLSRDSILPHYRERMTRALDQLRAGLDRTPALIHQPEGAMFLWLWLRDLPISASELYERLKARGVLAVPGHHFFPGLDPTDDWPHRDQCLRITYSQAENDVREGLEIICDEVGKSYAALKT